MIYKNKGGRYYLVKFQWKGKLYRKSTRTSYGQSHPGVAKEDL